MEISARLRLVSISLSVETSAGRFGRTLGFSEGLNIVRADNSSGKSTAVQSIIYALGLEGMLGPTQRVPLAHAMTDSVEIDGTSHRVTESWVDLTISNSAGRVITVRRAVVSATRDRKLVTVLERFSESSQSGWGSSDYYVRRAGAAQSGAGFHKFLADFLGLTLPRVTAHDGGEVPLYLETLFPYFYVEQKHGWSGVQARIPGYLGIRDVGKRSAEYLLGLDVFARTILRQRLRSNMAELETDWLKHATEADQLALSSKLILRNPMTKIGAGFEEASLEPLATDGKQWKPLQTVIEKLEAEIASFGEVKTVGADASSIEEDLDFHEQSLRASLSLDTALAEEEREADGQLKQVEARIEALEEDLRRHLDVQILEQYGSDAAHAMLADHICPTCHQDVADGADISRNAMTTAESVTFIRQQLATFGRVRSDQLRVLRAIRVRREALQAQASEHRGAIRAARESLVSANSSPSLAEVARRVRAEARLEELRARKQQFDELRPTFSDLATRWAEQKRLLTEAQGEELSKDDREKLAKAQASLRAQLDAYGFKSLPVDEIEIDSTTFRPAHEGFDLGFDISASDMIRLIWAYLFSLLEVGVGDGNHLGLLIFDEPRQQDTARTSFQALLAHASEAGQAGAQVIFATSESRDSLNQMLQGSDHKLISFDPGEKLLKLVETTDPFTS